MQLKQVQQILDAKVCACEDAMDVEIYAACGCDLMSDVLAFAEDNILLLTGLVNLQVIRTADMLDIKAITFVRGKKPTQDMIELAEEKGIVLLTTRSPLYPACGELYKAGLKGKNQ